jgi:hypothetical protein
MRPDGGLVRVGNIHEVDGMKAAMIERCRAAGLNMTQTANIVGVGVNTINKYYKEDWNSGTSNLVVNIAQNMAVIATDPNHKQAVAAGKFMLATLAPDVFSQRRQIQMLGADGQPIDPGKKTLDPYLMTDEQRELLKETLADVLKDAVDDAQQYKDGQLPEGEYVAIEDQSGED